MQAGQYRNRHAGIDRANVYRGVVPIEIDLSARQPNRGIDGVIPLHQTDIVKPSARNSSWAMYWGPIAARRIKAGQTHGRRLWRRFGTRRRRERQRVPRHRRRSSRSGTAAGLHIGMVNLLFRLTSSTRA